MTSVLEHGYVKFIERWGIGEIGLDEAGIIEAARQSTQGSFRGWERDEKLLRFLYEHEHNSPFEFAGLIIEVQAPIFVFREWHRHRSQSYNEMSARYTALPDLFYIPSIERVQHGKQATKNKQGSSTEDSFTEIEAEEIRSHISLATARCRASYEFLLDKGLTRELARLIIPLNQYSRMRACTSLRSWLAFLTLRMAPDTQWETRQYAKAVADIIKGIFPRTWQLFEADL